MTVRWIDFRTALRGVDRRRLLAFVLATAIAETAAGAPAAGAEIANGRNLYVATATHCLAPGYEELACGAFGTYFVGTGEDCGQSKVDLSGAGLYVETPAEVSLRSADSWSPCAGGRCFSDEPRGPWVAVVDWEGAHGESVGETIRQASGYSVEARLFPLQDPGVDAIDRLPAVNDAHVLAQLCHVAGAAAVHRPLAVNLSFGRLDRASCEQSRTLACELERVLAHLRRDLRIPIFAAAGHEGQLLFPAADPRVMAVGSLDVAHLAATGEARPLPQTPRGYGALFAGQGIYLEEPGGKRVWAAPPGSSYASALAAGWWAAYRRRAPELADKLLGLCDGSLAPGFDGRRIYLACGSLELPGSDLAGANALLATALGMRPEICGRTPAHTDLLLEVAGPAPAGEAPRLTLADLQAQLARPAPDSRPCVPCHGSGGGGDNGGGGSSGYTADVLEVDLSASWGIPDEIEPLGIYLQVGRKIFRFSDSENPILLDAIAQGAVDRLTLRNMPRRDGAPVAFVYSLRLRTGGPAFRSTTPILVHRHRKEP